jgi:hypothetical protein
MKEEALITAVFLHADWNLLIKMIFLFIYEK